jgi:phosphonate transport system permease protein
MRRAVMSETSEGLAQSPPSEWRFPHPYGLRSAVLVSLAVVVLWKTGQDVEIDRALVMSGGAIAEGLGFQTDSPVARGFSAIMRQMFPPQISETVETSRIEHFDRSRLPWLSHLDVQRVAVKTLDPETLALKTTWETREVLVRPFGYLFRVAAKLVETLEIGLWGTLLAVMIAAPLAILSARNLAPNHLVVVSIRALVSLFRAIPEFISALFFVLAYGFGPIAGVLALALHAAGFLGKFFAEDMENADPKPQESLTAIGAGRMKVLAYAILPEVLPQYIAYTFYILDRNVRMATVIGLVGAGGIGQELKGRYDLYNYAHVSTILIAIFVLVFALDHVSSRLRRLCL